VIALDLKDLALLDKQLAGHLSRPPNLIALAFAAVIFGGIVIIFGAALLGRVDRATDLLSPPVTGSISKQSPASDPVPKTEPTRKVN
jgi:hypothetical protein